MEACLRIALFITCYGDTLFPETGQAVVAVLERLGHRVDFPFAQTCCGQMHYNSGYHREARPILRQFVRAFGDSEIIVAPSSSCTALIRQYYGRMAEAADDPALAEEVAAMVPRVFEFSEFLVRRLGVEDVGSYFPHRVTYHPTCNSLRALRLVDGPKRLLKAVRGLELVELPEAEECCGFGGTFSIKDPNTSIAMLTDKLRAVLDTRAEVCTALDNSCLLQIGGALRRLRAGIRTVHLAEILAATEEEEALHAV